MADFKSGFSVEQLFCMANHEMMRRKNGIHWDRPLPAFIKSMYSQSIIEIQHFSSSPLQNLVIGSITK